MKIGTFEYRSMHVYIYVHDMQSIKFCGAFYISGWCLICICVYTQFSHTCISLIVQLLEEMLDNGYPLATESNVLKELIKPPSIVRSVVHTITGESKLAK